jgi:hypothetical protein
MTKETAALVVIARNEAIQRPVFLDCFVPRNDGRLSFIGKAFARFCLYEK